MHRVVALAAVAVLLSGSAVVGALVLAQSQTTGGAATTAAASRPPSPTASAAPGSSTAGPSSSVTVTASSAPGTNALALAGSGPGHGRFAPAAAPWSLHTTYTCPAGAPAFSLVVTDPTGAVVVATQGPTGGDERRTVPAAGTFALEISGGCRWTVEATG